MELLSNRFRERIAELLDQPSNLLATIGKKGDGFIDRIKRRSDVAIIEVTRENRDRMGDELAARIKAELALE